VEVRDSRARIVAAQLEERRKIERNLHDGAQQRLLALALRLRAAEVSNEPERLRLALESGVEEVQEAVRELRNLANGLHPSILNDGGLGAAFDDLASRTPIRVKLSTTDDRFSPGVEEAAWYIACEAVANTVKHAGASTVVICLARENGHLSLVISDDGVGGADRAGSGLRGIADRADALGGRVLVETREGGGTIIRAELPCES
jgi:signal transduction histidine kinase